MQPFTFLFVISAQMKYWIDTFFIVYFLILGLLILWRALLHFFGENEYTPAVNKAALIRATVRWCACNLGYPPGHRKLPGLEISYYKHKKFHGLFFSGNRKIRIYPNNHASAASLINTIIHEYIHYLEVTNVQNQQLYNQYTLQSGYEKNPFEISARKKADEFTPACIQDLVKEGMLKAA
jgi:hypothetical protein